MNGKTLIRMMILVVFEYVITTTIAWRWVLGADFPWWKPFAVSLVAIVFLVLRMLVYSKGKVSK